MPVTATNVTKWGSQSLELVEGDFAFDASYDQAGGGEAVTLAQLGLTSELMLLQLQPTAGYVFQWVPGATHRIRVFRTAGGTPTGTVAAPVFTGDALAAHGHNVTPATITQGVAVIRIYHGAVAGGPFQVGETITGGTSGATGVVTVVGTGFLTYTIAAGALVTGEVITGGTSGATATTSTAPLNGWDVTAAGFVSITVGENNGGAAFTQVISSAVPLTNEFRWRSGINSVETLVTDGWTSVTLEGVQIASLTTSGGTPAGTNSAPAFTGVAVGAGALVEVANTFDLSGVTGVAFTAIGR